MGQRPAAFKGFDFVKKGGGLYAVCYFDGYVGCGEESCS